MFIMQAWTFFWQALLVVGMAAVLALILIFLGGCLTTFWNGIFNPPGDKK